MKTRLITIFTILLSVIMQKSYAQDQNEAALHYNMMKTDVKTKNYDSGVKNLEWCLENSPALTANIYIYGGRLVKSVLKASPEKKEEMTLLGTKLYEKRFENFPDASPAKAYSDYGDFLKSVDGDKEEIFNQYQKAFDIDPTQLGVGSIISYFTAVVEKNKATDLPKVFNTYDNTIEAINKKVAGYLDNIQTLTEKEESGETLTTAEKRKLKGYKQNSKAFGQVETIFDKKMEEISTCEYLIPLYTEEFKTKKDDEVWLTRSINRMFKKDCTEDPLYASLVEQYQEVAPSPSASILYAGLLMERGETPKAISYFEKAISQETDPTKKANHLYKVANIYKKRGQSAKAVSYAKRAIQSKSNFGRAYTMIATIYAKAANSCGKDEFEKRMVYVAAKTYALKAKQVDASIGTYASKLAKSYAANQPSKKIVFNNDSGLKSGDSFTLKCWVGETVIVP